MRSISLILCLLFTACVTQESRQSDAQAGAGKPLQPATVEAFTQALESMKNGQLEKAQAQFTKLTRSHPELTGPHVNLGILQLETDPKLAETFFRTALQLDPGHRVANNQLGLLLRRQGRFAEAESAYLAALSQHPDYLPAHRNIGILYDLYLGQPAKALHHYQRCQALQQQPDRQIAGWIIDLERRSQEQPP